MNHSTSLSKHAKKENSNLKKPSMKEDLSQYGFGPIHSTPINVLQRFMKTDEEQQQQLLDKLMDEVDWPAYNPPLYRSEWARILRSPLKGKGHVTMDMCNPSGHIERTVISRSDLESVPALFVALRKSTWGGLFPALSQQDEELGLSAVDSIQSPLGKQKSTSHNDRPSMKTSQQVKTKPQQRENGLMRRGRRASDILEDGEEDDNVLVMDSPKQSRKPNGRKGVSGGLGEDLSEEDIQKMLRSLNLMGSKNEKEYDSNRSNEFNKNDKDTGSDGSGLGQSLGMRGRRRPRPIIT
eukprot:CAMPEP_0170096082 /NCGR_PEP_ID=MMETSP0019_2-20121128/28358_1 /TAXON_ID=98059 /ORGANISM="Dinobryon sp., Strain UTEXLB2267" /LENGTH=294 /DNA_ID=CAMNT_0010317973 /DNA_START=56 /DNA_END=938 /DNA_ORIENTATION=-